MVAGAGRLLGGGRRKERGVSQEGDNYGVAHARGDGVEVERRIVYFLVHLCLFYSVVALLLWFVVDEGVCGGWRGRGNKRVSDPWVVTGDSGWE